MCRHRLGPAPHFGRLWELARRSHPPPYSFSPLWNRIQRVAMNVSPPCGRLPRWVWVNAVGAISRLPVRGAI